MHVRRLYEKYKSIFWYGVSGILTTAVNFFVYWLCVHVLGIDVMTGSAVGWLISVMTAYVTNRAWVFESRAEGLSAVFLECLKFYACRAGTECADLAGMWLFVKMLYLPDMPVKIILNIVIIILNYMLSKVLVFAKSGASG